MVSISPLLLLPLDSAEVSAEAELTRTTFAPPVLQRGARQELRGSLGETWIGTVEGGRVRILSGFRRRGAEAEEMAIALLSPNGGEFYGTANEVEIRWRSGGGGTAVLDLAWSSDGGATWQEIVSGQIQDEPGEGSFTWSTPALPVPAASVRIRATTDAATVLDESDAPFAIVDDDPPQLVLGVLANPYVGLFVDLFAVSDESVSPEGLAFELGGEGLSAVQLDEEGRIFWLDHVLEGPVDQLAIRACAEDLAGNVGCVEGELAVRSAVAGEVSWSADRRFGVVLPADRGGRTIAILESFEEELGGNATADGPVAEPAHGVPAGSTASATAQTASITGTYRVFGEESVDVRIAIPLPDAGTDGWPEFTLLGPDGPLELWVDREKGLAWASTFQLGEFRIVPGRTGTFREIDDRVASIRAAAPNPFVGETVIAFEIGDARPVTLTVHDVTGRRVASLLDRIPFPPGPHTVRWDGSADGAGGLPAGTYWLRLSAGRGGSSERVVLLR